MMDAELTQPFRLVATCTGAKPSLGTAWFVTRSKVITAWHVIEGMPPETSYRLEIGGEPIRLAYVPGTESRTADLAVLHVRDEDRARITPSMVLPLAERRPGLDEPWSAKGFPERREGDKQSVTGDVTDPGDGHQRIQLFLKQGTEEAWDGMSGSAVIVDHRVAGILTSQSGYRDKTAYAAFAGEVESVVPELHGRVHRLAYRAWLQSEFRTPGWCRSYAVKLTMNGRELDVDQLAQMIARGGPPRVWLVIGDDAEGREAVLRSVADRFADNDAAQNEDSFDLPIWCAPSAHGDGAVAALDLARMKQRLSERDPSGNARQPDTSSPADLIVENVAAAVERGRALFVIDGAEPADIERLRTTGAGHCSILAGVHAGAATGVGDAQRCRIVALSGSDRTSLAHHWLGAAPGSEQATIGPAMPHTGSRPLDVLIWCRAEWISARLEQLKAGRSDPEAATCATQLGDLVERVLGGASVADQLHSAGMGRADEIERAREFLAELAYWTLIEGVEDITPDYVARKKKDGSVIVPARVAVQDWLAQIAEQCGLLQRTAAGTYRHAHTALHEYLASLAMRGATLRLNQMADHAAAILKDAPRVARWARALALRLDVQIDDAKQVLATLLNHGLPRGYGTLLRNRSGELRDIVCQAILHTERLSGSKLREALGWVELPSDWTGYCPDEWRTIEEILRYLDGLAQRLEDDRSLALLLSRMVQDASVINIALFRYSLAKELKRRAKAGLPSPKLAELYERERFFTIAGHPIEKCAEVKLGMRAVPHGWFLMGAPKGEERSWPNEWPRHRVLLHRYMMASTEVTNAQYEIFDPDHRSFRCSRVPREGGKDPDRRDHHPVVRVSWYEAWCFAEWMGMKLPTEAQWEKAARGFNDPSRPETVSQEPMPYWFSQHGGELSTMVCFKDNARDTREVGHSESAEFPFEIEGLSGNVWEWCMDQQGHRYSAEDEVYPPPFEVESEEDVITNRAIRGGSYDSPAWNCRHAVRHFTFPTVRADTIGFRLCADCECCDQGNALFGEPAAPAHP